MLAKVPEYLLNQRRFKVITLEEVEFNITESLKSKKVLETSVYRSLKNSLQVWEKSNPGKAINDECVLQVIKKMIRQREESASIFEEHNYNDKAILERAEITILSKYLPRSLSESDLKSLIENSELTNIGDIMKYLREYSKSNSVDIDMKLASSLIKELLS